jgi:hypothetical protein
VTEGWHTVTADGRSHPQLEQALSYRPGRPNAVIAHVESSW